MGDRVRLRLGGAEPVVIGGRRWHHDFAAPWAYAHGSRTGRADRTATHTQGGGEAAANRSGILRTDPEGRPAPLVSRFAPPDGGAAVQADRPPRWREL
ncbi:hypothetical protein E0500_035400 [Streptomyces sp. KM273126]|uniref:hypothetical protein n=1 Tax=Streptomyces sp. KM273126 TaxID=2545247 RepID=UPI00103B647D|nr:hypothetical protein [Streptomyces sp. KM273126]MBA2812472.1 hypothetical protein [Streptomyces sp. KM273126]